MARYRPNGSLDPTFAGGGRTLVTLPGMRAGYNQRRGLAVLPDGRFLVATDAIRDDDFASLVAVARFTASGALDTTFGTGGVAAVPGDGVHDVELDSAGRILVPANFRPPPTSRRPGSCA